MRARPFTPNIAPGEVISSLRRSRWATFTSRASVSEAMRKVSLAVQAGSCKSHEALSHTSLVRTRQGYEWPAAGEPQQHRGTIHTALHDPSRATHNPPCHTACTTTLGNDVTGNFTLMPHIIKATTWQCDSQTMKYFSLHHFPGTFRVYWSNLTIIKKTDTFTLVCLADRKITIRKYIYRLYYKH